MNLLLAEQRVFDEKRFDQSDWQIKDWRAQKTRHISLHISKTLLKLYQGDRIQTVNEVIPDLSIYRSQLINAHDLSADVCDNTDKRVPSEAAALREVAAGNGELAYYLEPLEHSSSIDENLRVERVTNAVGHLHVAVESLAHFHNVSDIQESHHERMRSLLGAEAIGLGFH